MSWWGAIIEPIVGLVKEPIVEWQKRKTIKQEQEHEINKIEHETKLALVNTKLEMAKKGQEFDYSLDKISLQNMDKSWKDEFILLVFIAPMIMAFIPNFAMYALNGFEIIDKMPDWYVSLIIGMVVVIYGMRGLLTKALEFFGNKLKVGK